MYLGKKQGGKFMPLYQYETAATLMSDAEILSANNVYRVSRRDKSRRKGITTSLQMNLQFTLFLFIVIVVIGFLLLRYLSLHSECITSAKTLSELKSRHHSLSLQNDDQYRRIVDNIDLNKIKHVAMTEMGMIYPDRNQIITYKSTDRNYVIQYMTIP